MCENYLQSTVYRLGSGKSHLCNRGENQSAKNLRDDPVVISELRLEASPPIAQISASPQDNQCHVSLSPGTKGNLQGHHPIQSFLLFQIQLSYFGTSVLLFEGTLVLIQLVLKQKVGRLEKMEPHSRVRTCNRCEASDRENLPEQQQQHRAALACCGKAMGRKKPESVEERVPITRAGSWEKTLPRQSE